MGIFNLAVWLLAFSIRKAEMGSLEGAGMEEAVWERVVFSIVLTKRYHVFVRNVLTEQSIENVSLACDMQRAVPRVLSCCITENIAVNGR